MVAFEVEYPQPILEAGIAAAPLIARPATWINRRVETIRLLSHGGNAPSGVDRLHVVPCSEI
jgi:hypothetical protein